MIEAGKYDGQSIIGDVISKIQYISKEKYYRIFSFTCFGWTMSMPAFTKTRFSHHLGDQLGCLQKTSKAATYFTTGLAVTATAAYALADPGLASPDTHSTNASSQKTAIAKTAGLIGSLLMVAPFVSAFQKAKLDEP